MPHLSGKTKAVELGRRGEAFVAQQLAAAGWQIVAQNLRYRATEIDLLIRKGTTMAVVEVKTRSSWSDVDVSSLLLPRKAQALRRGLERFLGAGIPDGIETQRLDLVLVATRPSLHIIRYIPDALPLDAY